MIDTTTRQPLSETQREILKTLVIYTYKNRRQPSMAELAALCGRSSVQRDLDRIAACGWLGRPTGIPRGADIPPDVYDYFVAEYKREQAEKLGITVAQFEAREEEQQS